MRLTTYRDTARTIPVEIREEFGARTDKLIRRVRRPLERRLHESFDAGASSAAVNPSSRRRA